MEPVIAGMTSSAILHSRIDPVMGHRDLLPDLVLSLVHDALEHDRPGGHVYLTMEKA